MNKLCGLEWKTNREFNPLEQRSLDYATIMFSGQNNDLVKATDVPVFLRHIVYVIKMT